MINAELRSSGVIVALHTPGEGGAVVYLGMEAHGIREEHLPMAAVSVQTRVIDDNRRDR